MLTIAPRAEALSRLGRAVADPTRSRILLSLMSAPGYSAQLARELGLTRTNVSNHLACLRGCGIVVAEPEGRRTRYEIADPHLTAALNSLVEVTLAVDRSAPCSRAAGAPPEPGTADCDAPAVRSPGVADLAATPGAKAGPTASSAGRDRAPLGRPQPPVAAAAPNGAAP
jgi:DNA-binding transcriptional ArsR family regulator